MVVSESASPVSREGIASGTRTLRTTCNVEAPIERDASITPRSTSLIELSTTRATKGAAAITNGTTVAVEPILVPVIKRVIGTTATSKMRNGTERKILTIAPKIWLTGALGWMPFLSVTTKISPKGRPMI